MTLWYVWMIAIANAFVYCVRYGVVDWAPTYLLQVKQLSVKNSGWGYFIYEYAGIPGTLLAGWLSDKYFKGRRSPVTFLFMIGVIAALFVYWKNLPFIHRTIYKRTRDNREVQITPGRMARVIWPLFI